ncbi:MAG TPA: hypothetical protein VFI59_14125 [Actinomycetota bacterium]|nr:hypothetical protein [Actinomycetota bacterium]
MNATRIQNPSQSVHTGSPWALVGIAAVMVLIVTVLTIGLAGDVGEKTGPALKAPVAEIQVEAPANDFALHGRGLVDMPDQTVAKDHAGAMEATANETSGGGAEVVPKTACPERLALKLFC